VCAFSKLLNHCKCIYTMLYWTSNYIHLHSKTNTSNYLVLQHTKRYSVGLSKPLSSLITAVATPKSKDWQTICQCCLHLHIILVSLHFMESESSRMQFSLTTLELILIRQQWWKKTRMSKLNWLQVLKCFANSRVHHEHVFVLYTVSGSQRIEVPSLKEDWKTKRKAHS